MIQLYTHEEISFMVFVVDTKEIAKSLKKQTVDRGEIGQGKHLQDCSLCHKYRQIKYLQAFLGHVWDKHEQDHEISAEYLKLSI